MSYNIDDATGYLLPVYLPPVYLGTAVVAEPEPESDLSCLSCGGTGVTGGHICEEVPC